MKYKIAILTLEGRRVHDPRTSNYAQDDNTQTGESLRSAAVARGITSPRATALVAGTAPKTKAIQDDITSPRAAELAEDTAAALSSMESVIPVDPKTGERQLPGRAVSFNTEPYEGRSRCS